MDQVISDTISQMSNTITDNFTSAINSQIAQLLVVGLLAFVIHLIWQISKEIVNGR